MLSLYTTRHPLEGPAVQTGVDGLACQKQAVARTGRRREEEAQQGLQAGSGRDRRGPPLQAVCKCAWDRGLALPEQPTQPSPEGNGPFFLHSPDSDFCIFFGFVL